MPVHPMSGTCLVDLKSILTALDALTTIIKLNPRFDVFDFLCILRLIHRSHLPTVMSSSVTLFTLSPYLLDSLPTCFLFLPYLFLTFS